MRAVLCAALLACTALAPAGAQTVSAEATAARRCLTWTPEHAGLPDYPFDEMKRKVKGRVKVELVFTLPDKRPETIVVDSEGGAAFVDAVKEHARHLRVPCLRTEEVPSRVLLDFVFNPDDRRVVGARPEDPEEARREALLQCLAHTSGSKALRYPPEAERQGISGRVSAWLIFDAPDKAPAVKVLSTRDARLLARAVEAHAKGYRLPCHEGAPVIGSVLHVFKFEGAPEYGMPNITLPQFLKSMELEKLRLAMDTNTMSCPFDLQMTYYRPVARNNVQQMDNYNSTREPLVHWLRDATLHLADRHANAVFGDTFTLTVPCLKLDLKPKE